MEHRVFIEYFISFPGLHSSRTIAQMDPTDVVSTRDRERDLIDQHLIDHFIK
jgi:hypothetical protein